MEQEGQRERDSVVQVNVPLQVGPACALVQSPWREVRQEAGKKR